MLLTQSDHITFIDHKIILMIVFAVKFTKSFSLAITYIQPLPSLSSNSVNRYHFTGIHVNVTSSMS